MNIQEKIQKLRSVLNEVKMAAVLTQVSTADGTTLFVDGDLVEGAGVYSDENQTPMADGDYVLTDGTTITVTGGLIAMVTDAVTPEETTTPDTEMATETPDNGIAELKAEVAQLKTDMESLIEYLQEASKNNADLSKANKVLQSKVEQLSKEPAGEPVVIVPTVSTELSRQDRIKHIKSLVINAQ